MNTDQSFNLATLNPTYAPLIAQALKAINGYSLTPLGHYNGQTIYTNREGLYIGQTQAQAHKATPSELELSLNEVN